MGECGYRRVARELSWDVSRRALVGFYQRLLGTDTPARDDDENVVTIENLFLPESLTDPVQRTEAM